jgi:superkiller protein 3
MGRGYILQRANKYADARTLFTRVAELLPDDTVVGIRAKEEEAWCRVLLNKAAEAEDSLTELAVALDHLEERNEDQARCWYRLGRCLWELGSKSFNFYPWLMINLGLNLGSDDVLLY